MHRLNVTAGSYSHWIFKILPASFSLFLHLGIKTKPVGEKAHYSLTDWRCSSGAIMYYLNWSMLSFCWPGFPSQRHDTAETWWDLTWVPPVTAGSLKPGLCMGEEGVPSHTTPNPSKHPTGQREEGTFGRCHSSTHTHTPSMGADHPASCGHLAPTTSVPRPSGLCAVVCG